MTYKLSSGRRYLNGELVDPPQLGLWSEADLFPELDYDDYDSAGLFGLAMDGDEWDKIEAWLITFERMKNIQVIDGADNSVYDIFAAIEEEFALIFPDSQDIGFIEEVMEHGPEKELGEAFSCIWKRCIPKRDAMGITAYCFTS